VRSVRFSACAIPLSRAHGIPPKRPSMMRKAKRCFAQFALSCGRTNSAWADRKRPCCVSSGCHASTGFSACSEPKPTWSGRYAFINRIVSLSFGGKILHRQVSRGSREGSSLCRALCSSLSAVGNAESSSHEVRTLAGWFRLILA
jgi:hypothetical protein